jgi:hypothetical protein
MIRLFIIMVLTVAHHHGAHGGADFATSDGKGLVIIFDQMTPG